MQNLWERRLAETAELVETAESSFTDYEHSLRTPTTS